MKTSVNYVVLSGRTAALGAATETTLVVSSNWQTKLRIERVKILRVSGTAATFTPRIVSTTGAAAGSIAQEWLGAATPVANLLDATAIDGVCNTDALGNLYLACAPNAGADNVFDYRIWCEVLG